MVKLAPMYRISILNSLQGHNRKGYAICDALKRYFPQGTSSENQSRSSVRRGKCLVLPHALLGTALVQTTPE